MRGGWLGSLFLVCDAGSAIARLRRERRVSTSVSTPLSYTISPVAQMAANRVCIAMASLSRARGTCDRDAAAMMCVSSLRT